MFASQHWPRWGNERIQEVMRGQRDMYANLNNQVLHLANSGRHDQPDPQRLRAAEVAAGSGTRAAITARTSTTHAA